MRCENCGAGIPEFVRVERAQPVDHHQCINQLMEIGQIFGVKIFFRNFVAYKTKAQEVKRQLDQQLNEKLIAPPQETQELRTENQRLTNSLTLKDREQADLQAQIRALNSQLSERENNQPSQLQIRKLADQLELVKNKLTQ